MHERKTHDTGQTGLTGVRGFGARKQSNCKLIGDHPAKPSDSVSWDRCAQS
jgi:hypothetical protein